MCVSYGQGKERGFGTSRSFDEYYTSSRENDKRERDICVCELTIPSSLEGNLTPFILDRLGEVVRDVNCITLGISSFSPKKRDVGWREGRPAPATAYNILSLSMRPLKVLFI